MSIETIVVEYTAEQVSGLITELAIKAFIAALACVLSLGGAAKLKDEIIRKILAIIALISALASVTWFAKILWLVSQPLA